jgi:hypothetical protein
MRKVLMAAAALVAMAGAAHAQGVATQQVNLTATVGGYCTIDSGATGTARSATVTPVNGKVSAGSLNVTGTPGNVICTSNAKIQLTTASGGMTNGTAPADTNYTNKIHYTARATYNGITETLTTTDTTTAGFQTTGTNTTLGAKTNVPLDITVETIATPVGKFLVNGTYTDTITVTLSPTA